MRTILIKNLEINQPTDLIISGDDAFHLSKVVRVKLNDEIQLTNGKGLAFSSHIKLITKKDIHLQIVSHKIFTRTHHIALLCGQTKKHTTEEIIRLAVELGITHLFFWKSEYGQDVTLSEQRIQLIIKNAMEQSNNYWLPEIYFIENLNSNLVLKNMMLTHGLAIFHNQIDKKESEFHKEDNTLICVGPEGGLSVKDLAELNTLNNHCRLISLATPILTTPSAVACSVGFMLAKNGWPK